MGSMYGGSAEHYLPPMVGSEEKALTFPAGSVIIRDAGPYGLAIVGAVTPRDK